MVTRNFQTNLVLIVPYKLHQWNDSVKAIQKKKDEKKKKKVVCEKRWCNLPSLCIGK